MGFFSDLGDLGSAVFTGRWTGGQNSVGDVVSRDPWVLAAPAALAAAPFVAPAIGGALGIGGAAEAAGVGATAAEGAADAGAAGLADAGLTYGPTLEQAGLAINPATGGAVPAESLGAFASADTAAGTTEAAPSWLTGAQATPATGTGAFGGASPSGGVSDFFSNLGSQIVKNPLQDLGIAAAGAGLVGNLMKGNAAPEAQDRLSNIAAFNQTQAAQLSQQGEQFKSYLANGTLPGWAQAQVQQMVAAAKARAVANAAKAGGNTDPSSNTALATDFANIEQQAIIMGGKIEEQLATFGEQEVQDALKAGAYSSDALKIILQQEQNQQNNITQSISALAAAFAGGGKGINLKLGS